MNEPRFERRSSRIRPFSRLAFFGLATLLAPLPALADDAAPADLPVSIAVAPPLSALSMTPTLTSVSETLAAYHGDWRRIQDPEEESLRVTEIESAISELTWVVRKMAGGVLKKTTVPPPTMNFAWDGAQLHQLTRGKNGHSRRPVRLDGEPELLTDHRGEDFTSHWTWTEEGLEVHWVQDQAYGSNLYRVDDNHQTLTVEHRIHVTAISSITPIVYRSKFDRAEAASVSAGPPEESAQQMR